jgi:hypothetical protein
MVVLHRDLLWFVTLLSVALMATGFLMAGEAHLLDERRLSLLTDALPLAIAYIDTRERYRFVNSNYATLHGETPETIIGSKVEQIAGRELLEQFREHSARARQGKLETYQRRAQLADGELHDLHSDLLPDIGRDGRVAGFFLLLRDETQRLQLEREVVRVAEAERLSVARDLHDGLGQSLTGISLALVALVRQLDQEGSKHVPLVAKLTATTQNAIEQTRQFTHLLAPTMQGELFAALRSLAAEVSTLYNVECYTRCPPDELALAPPAAMHLYRIAQESVSNATRHGRASTINVDCRLDGPMLVLEIIDNGSGIPPRDQRRDGMGLGSMYYRARMIGGVLEVVARPAGGTEVTCRVPLAFLANESQARAPGQSNGNESAPEPSSKAPVVRSKRFAGPANAQTERTAVPLERARD